MAAPVFAGAGAADAQLGNTINLPFPAGLAADDILIAQCETRDNVEIATPVDWNQDAVNGFRNSNATNRGEWFWKRATGLEAGSEAFTRALVGATTFFGRMYRFTGCITTGTPYDVSDQAGIGNSALWTPAPLTLPDAQDRLMLCLVMANQDVLLPGDYTGGTVSPVPELAESETTVGNDATLHLAGIDYSLAGLFDYGSQTVALTNSQTLFTLALLPVGVVPPIVGDVDPRRRPRSAWRSYPIRG